MKKKHVILLIIVGVLIIGIISAVIAVKTLQTNLDRKMSELTIENVDLTKIPDGVSYGSCKIFPINVEVKVTVKDHRIEAIELLKHENGKGQGAEVLPGKVVEAQSLKVDTISAATYSSKVILKAIENALNSAGKQ